MEVTSTSAAAGGGGGATWGFRGFFAEEKWGNLGPTALLYSFDII